MHTRPPIAATAVAVLCLTLSLMTFARQTAAAEQGAATPEALAKALEETGKTKDVRKVVALTHPDDRPMWAMAMVMAAGMAAELSDNSKAATKEFDALMGKHGLKDFAEAPIPEKREDVEAAAREGLKNVDLVALIPELSDFLVRYKGESKKEMTSAEKLTDIKIQGDTATAMAGGKTVRFEKAGGRWYVRMRR